MRREVSPREAAEAVKTRVVLEFMRHGEKGAKEAGKSEEEIRLTPVGREQADAKGKSLRPQVEVSVGRASPRKRTAETALHAILAGQVSPQASLEEMEEQIAAEMKVGKKLAVDPRLSFDLSGPEGQEAVVAFKQGKFLPFLIHDSDRRAIETNDKVSSTYSRFAGNIAEIIARYVNMASNFNRLAAKTDKYEKYGNQLERYLGTHQGVVESFLAKVLEKVAGESKRDEFINSVGGGFKETEGIHVEIQNIGRERQVITITYGLNGKKETVNVEKTLLEEIIRDRAKFEEEVKKHSS